MKIPFFVVDAFTDTPFQGNPAGVFFDDAGDLTEAEMRQLCGEVSLESAFVSPATVPDADFCLRYFTSVMEVPLCGHATLAALTVLAQVGRIRRLAGVRVQTNVGVLNVSIGPENTVTLFQNLPTFGPECNAKQVTAIAAALGCTENDFVSTLPVQPVSTGTPWLFVPVTSRAIVDATPADYRAIQRLSAETETLGLYVFTIDAETDVFADALFVWSRCFAPIAGLNEDPVTGSASGALGGYLAHYNVLEIAASRSERVIVQQGFAGGRGGTAQIAVGKDDTGAINALRVSGQAVITAEGTFTVRRAD